MSNLGFNPNPSSFLIGGNNGKDHGLELFQNLTFWFDDKWITGVQIDDGDKHGTTKGKQYSAFSVGDGSYIKALKARWKPRGTAVRNHDCLTQLTFILHNPDGTETEIKIGPDKGRERSYEGIVLTRIGVISGTVIDGLLIETIPEEAYVVYEKMTIEDQNGHTIDKFDMVVQTISGELEIEEYYSNTTRYLRKTAESLENVREGKVSVSASLDFAKEATSKIGRHFGANAEGRIKSITKNELIEEFEDTKVTTTTQHQTIGKDQVEIIHLVDCEIHRYDASNDPHNPDYDYLISWSTNQQSRVVSADTKELVGYWDPSSTLINTFQIPDDMIAESFGIRHIVRPSDQV